MTLFQNVSNAQSIILILTENVFALIEIVNHVHLLYMGLALNAMQGMPFLLIIHVDVK